MTAKKIRPMNGAQIFDAIASPKRFDCIETLRSTGWATDGVMVFRPSAKLLDVLLSRSAGRPPRDSLTGVLSLERILKTLAVKGKLSPCRMGGDTDSENGVLRYALRGARFHVVVDAVRYETLRKYHPQATAFVSSRKREPVAFCEDGKIVAVLMPWI